MFSLSLQNLYLHDQIKLSFRSRLHRIKITMFKEITTIFHHKTRPPTASFTICSIEIKGTANYVKKGLKSCGQK